MAGQYLSSLHIVDDAPGIEIGRGVSRRTESENSRVRANLVATGNGRLDGIGIVIDAGEVVAVDEEGGVEAGGVELVNDVAGEHVRAVVEGEGHDAGLGAPVIDGGGSALLHAGEGRGRRGGSREGKGDQASGHFEKGRTKRAVSRVSQKEEKGSISE